MRFPVFMQVWTLVLVICTAAVAVAFVRLDTAIARIFWTADRPLGLVGEILGASVLLSAEAATILIVVLMRMLGGHASRLGETLALACLTSMCAYAFNDHVLKVLFGVPGPADFIHGATHAAHLMRGTDSSSFPSGHMVLAGAFSGVFMKMYRWSIWPLSTLLVITAGLLVVGDWHYLSDAIAGAFLGISAGLLAAMTWSTHLTNRAARNPSS